MRPDAAKPTSEEASPAPRKTHVSCLMVVAWLAAFWLGLGGILWRHDLDWFAVLYAVCWFVVLCVVGYVFATLSINRSPSGRRQDHKQDKKLS